MKFHGFNEYPILNKGNLHFKGKCRSKPRWIGNRTYKRKVLNTIGMPVGTKEYKQYGSLRKLLWVIYPYH